MSKTNCPKSGVLECLKQHIPKLEDLGVKTLPQLMQIIDERDLFEPRGLYPLEPPERPVRVIHDGHTVKVPKPVVLVDTREREGFAYSFGRFSKWFSGVERKALRAGDYSIQGMEDRMAVERKSLADLTGSAIAGRSRFLTQCERLAELDRKVIVVEAALSQVKSPYETSAAHPNAVVGTMFALQERWGIQVLWCDTPELAEETVAHILSKYYTLHWLAENGHPRHFVDGDI